MFAMALPALGQSAPKSRILQPMNDSQRTVLRGNVHPFARAEFDRGRVNGSRKLEGVTVYFGKSPEQQAALKTFLAQQQDPASPNYKKALTSEQYAQRFGMNSDDLQRIALWAQSKGLTLVKTSHGRNAMSFSGTIAQFEAAFRTEFHNYNVKGEAHFANSIAPSLPSAMAGTVMGIRNMDDFRPKPRARRLMVANPDFTSDQTGNTFLAPDDFATIYNVKPLYTAGFDGTGQTVAIMGQTSITMSDITKFRSVSGLPTNNPELHKVSGSGSDQIFSGDIGEANLDLEWSGAVAKNATILYVYVGNNANFNVFDSLFEAVDNPEVFDRAPVISISYGNCEANLGLSNVNIIQDWVQEGNAHMQTIVGPSGDSGAADCDFNVTTATHGLAVDVPAAIPEVTGVGGSSFIGDINNQNTYWATTNNANQGSALQYIPEGIWNNPGGQLSAGGGGVSTMFNKPAWQTALTLADGKRDVPDVALAADPNHDGFLVCSEGSCVNGYRAGDGSLTVFGGTSAGAPTFAGILALANQATGSLGLGNANPVLYGLGGTNAFHEISSGDNKVPCASGSPNCPVTAPFFIGFSAGVGYDLVSGLGSINANNLVTAWPGFTPTPNFSFGGTPINISAPGGHATSTITVSATNGFSGTVDLAVTSCPTTSEITCTINPSSVDVNGSSETATLTISTAAPHDRSTTSAGLGGGKFGWIALSSGGLLASFLVVSVPTKRRSWSVLLGLLVFASLASAVACGGGGGGGGGNNDPGTPTGNYTVSMTATSGAITQTTNVTVTVQ